MVGPREEIEPNVLCRKARAEYCLETNQGEYNKSKKKIMAPFFHIDLETMSKTYLLKLGHSVLGNLGILDATTKDVEWAKMIVRVAGDRDYVTSREGSYLAWVGIDRTAKKRKPNDMQEGVGKHMRVAFEDEVSVK